MVCIKNCPESDDLSKFYCYDGYGGNYSQSVTDMSQGYCMWQLKSKKIVNRCITSQMSDAAETLAKQNNNTFIPNQNDSQTWYNNFISDIWTLRGYVFGFGLGVSLGVAFLYLLFLRIPLVLFATVWSMILSIEALLIVSTILLWKLAKDWEDEGIKTDNEILVIRVFEYIGIAFSILYFCLILVLRKRIMLALGIIKEASKALESMPAIVLFPIVQVCGCVAFLVPWLIYMICLASSGEIKNVTYTKYGANLTYKEYHYDDNTKWAFLYLLFCWFWTSQFIVAVGQIFIAMCIVAWYFTKDKSTIGNMTTFWAARVTLLYHSGTAAFGSLIIAFFKTIRAVVSYIQHKAAAHKNKLTECILCCIQCCLYCMEKCIKFLNKNAYIQTAIHGYSFCQAARTAFFLILRNCLRVFAVNMVADFVLMLSKVMIPGLTSLLFYLAVIYGRNQDTEINGIIAPTVIVFILSYFVACMFTELFGMAIETILLCYIADEEMFPAAERYAEGDLHESIQSTADACKEAGVHKTDKDKPAQGDDYHQAKTNEVEIV